ncbi:Putative Bacterial Ig-like domain [Minicystis rosea]|nr:Putative Bacterial Ig-like domain [Minicystis rosea]
MRFSRFLSAGLLTFAFAGSASAASPGLVSVSGRFSPAQAPQPAAAIAALNSAVPEEVRGTDLRAVRTVSLKSGARIVKLAQMHLGVPVAHRGASVTFGADGVARHVATRLEADLPASVTAAITAQQAAAAASQRTRLHADATRAKLVIWPTADGNKLAYAVAPASIPGLPYAPVVVVDAMSGDVILHYNTIVTLNEAKVYPSNPTKSPTLASVTLPVATGATTLQNELVVSKNCIDTHKAKKIDIMGFMLDVHVCELLQTALPDGDGNYLDAPGTDTAPEDTYAEISMFHHVNRAYDFFHGYDEKLDVNGGKPISTVSNLRIPQGFDTFDTNKLKDPDLPLAPFQNAFFAPEDPIFGAILGIEGGAMYFGQGKLRDYAYDGDVVYHEFTHAVVNATLQLVGTPHLDAYGVSMSPGAMNEGLADYFSSAIAGDPDVGEYAVGDLGPGSGSAIRTLDNQETCPKDIGGEVHQDASLFSGALWDTRKGLADDNQRALFDGAVYAAMNMSSTGDLGYEDMAKLIGDAVKTALGDTVATALTAAFTAHGVLPKCDRVLESDGSAMNGPAALQGLWMAPGTQTTGATTKGWTPGVVQFHQKLPDGSNKLTVDLTRVDIGGGGGVFGGGTPFEPKVLVSFGKEAIQFKYKPLTGPADLQTFDATEAANGYTITIDVPAGATDAWVMIGSKGQSDGAYTSVMLTANTVPVGTTSSSSSASSSSTSASSSSGEPEVVGGCGCAVPGEESTKSGAAVGALAALGLLLSRRRRRG